MKKQDNELMADENSENSDGITFKDLKRSLKEVRHKKEISKLQHKMKAKLLARPKHVDVEKMIDHFESKGIPVNKESLRSRSKTRRTIGNLEAAADKYAKKALDESDDDDIVEDDKMAAEESKTRGRKRKRDKSVDADLMDIDEGLVAKAKPSKLGRSLTPA